MATRLKDIEKLGQRKPVITTYPGNDDANQTPTRDYCRSSVAVRPVRSPISRAYAG